MVLEEKYTLPNGVEIPKLGLGTWFIPDDDALQAVKAAVKTGYRHIDTAQAYQNENGVGKADLDNILESCTVKPMVNQILVHVSNTPKELIQYCKNKDILVEAYSPIGHGELLKNEEVKKIAEKYNVSVPQLGIRYCLQLGTLPLPKTANPAHMKNNADVDFEISEEDMEFLKNMKKIEDYGKASMFPVYR